jgi:MYXO-CTERM domain-containing protein
VSLSPASAAQGGVITLVVDATEPFAGPVSVQTGDGLLVGSAVDTQGSEATFQLVIAGDTAPGAHDLVFDDGNRLWRGTLDVTEREILQRKTCSTTTGGDGLWALGLLALLARRRSRA